MQETSDSIAKWAETTFGPVKDLQNLVARAQTELAELGDAIADQEGVDAVLSEAADIAILLHRIAYLQGGDLNKAIDVKMSINRTRKWQPAGDGTGKHIA